MAAGPITQVSDIVNPELFTPAAQQLTEQKARLIRSGVMALDPELNAFLMGGGLTINLTSNRDLDDDDDNAPNDSAADIIVGSFENGTPTDANRNDLTPLKTSQDSEIAVRINRNQAWSQSGLAADLAVKPDPMSAILARVSFYWARKLQKIFVATWNGVIKDNVANDSGDYQNDISGVSFVDGVTNISAEAIIDTAVTAGDSMDKFTAMMVHSIVMAKMEKNDLIDFIPDSQSARGIATYRGLEVIVDDGLPNTGGVYDTWLFGPGAVRWGSGTPEFATEIDRQGLAGKGGGQTSLINRVKWILHPVGHSYTGTAPNSGPTNGTGANELNAAASWNRIWPERKQIPFARLVTRES